LDVESIRRYCLSFPRTKEKLQWGETLCFQVEEKIFSLLNLDVSSQTRLAFKSTPEKFAELIEMAGIRPAPYVGRYHWVALEQLDTLPDGELMELIKNSYDMVVTKTAKAKRSSKVSSRKSSQRKAEFSRRRKH